ncbi:TPA: tyrosine--tRNA ligase [Candidatus Campbellbacteria bacterium]|nr:MAG: tyrosyl-tRNA synthetase, tyrosyl-tRNA synthetase [Candidatus Campbellbacteria bacterium GW2011_OD1_34_28]KKP74906.1 MAG: Tyrosine-tRNA ligase [Candidatus Campbellbacteria bacterium GW2011_GWD2_35_24]KKP75792.1 MAG: tyrosyl-tRNA synthetase, tyrosyl-tRNA synthetase [Candidatus Campbellbacteria bacterium GW2011_GWC2_35_28]KKP76960.1 MAG: tyrosyl-tRNA synthetase, tyrosyl-tRNA synthetase [Candidatus Campbellbacteria bacterium GW2011_GWC1_35_31]KKP78886.1 MAG: Tyrosine-tRNA ligase [Candidatus
MKKIDNEKIKELLSRGTEEIISFDDLKKKLESGKKLRIKLGIDPTSPNIHLGRSIPLLKLRDFQELGHQAVFIIGDFTGTIGDTSDKESERPMLEQETIKKNLKNYIAQAGKIVDMKKAEIYYNSKWLGKLGYGEIGFQADQFSLNEFISRENISKRLDGGKRIVLRELLYPLMQAYDSVKVKADVELGGTDQKFNVLAGRTLQKAYKQEPQNIITNPLIEGLDGRKMSSSWGNTVNLFDSPDEMFGKLMSLKDEFIIRYFTLLTRVDMKEIRKYEVEMNNGANPKDYKMKLAYEIVRFYHSEKDAQKAKDNFETQFQKGAVPENVQEFKIKAGEGILVVLHQIGFASSNSEARRKIQEGAVKLDDEKVTDINYILDKGERIVRLGRKIGKLKIK